MSRTIKEIADLLEVSKTAVRNYMTEEFRAKYTEKDCKGTLLVSEEGCKLVAAEMGRMDKLPQQTENKFAETPESSENVTIPRSVLTMLEDQLRAKDEQIAKLQTLVDQAQQLHARSMPEPKQPLALEDKGRKKWLFGRKKGE